MMYFDDDNNGFLAYKTYLAIKQHFTRPKYDFFRYQGAINTNFEKYKNRTDRYYFYKLGKKYSANDLVYFFAANLMEKPNTWIGELCNDEARIKFNDTMRKLNAIEYNFKQECEKLLDMASKSGLKFNDIFKVSGNKHPYIVKALLQNKISIETYIVIDELVRFSDYLDKVLDEPLVYGRLKMRCDKYKPFVRFDMEKCKTILKQTVLDYDSVDKSTYEVTQNGK